MNIFQESTGHGKKIVLLHGWGGCNHKHMQPIVEQLANRYQVINFDLPGQGQSDWHPGIQNMQDIADQLLPFLPKEAIYIGASFGGQVAMALAAKYPERVSRLIGIATTPRFIADTDWPGIPQPGFQEFFIPGIKQKGWQAFMHAWFDYEFSTIASRPTAYQDLINMLDEDLPKINLDILFKGVYITDSTDLRKEFQLIQCPIDLLLGEKDDTIPTAAFEKIKALTPKVNIHIIPGAQHLSYWTHPKEFNKVLNHII